jgi:hypothetical protein
MRTVISSIIALAVSQSAQSLAWMRRWLSVTSTSSSGRPLRSA